MTRIFLSFLLTTDIPGHCRAETKGVSAKDNDKEEMKRELEEREDEWHFVPFQ